MVVFVSTMVDGCDTNAQGAVVNEFLRQKLLQRKNVTLDFSGVLNVTTSFVNTAFVELLRDFDYSVIKSLVLITNVNHQIGSMIKSRMKEEALLAA